MNVERNDRMARRGWGRLSDTLRADFEANPRDPKARTVLLWLRITQLTMGNLDKPRVISIPLIVTYRLFTETLFGLELRPKTSVGKGLALHHSFGLVVNDGALIGEWVTLRNGVTIGHARPGGKSPVICSRVNVGANASVIGEVVVGEGAVVGAGAVVISDIPANATCVGVPARIVSK